MTCVAFCPRAGECFPNEWWRFFAGSVVSCAPWASTHIESCSGRRWGVTLSCIAELATKDHEDGIQSHSASRLCLCVDLLDSVVCDGQDDGSWPVPPVESMVKSFNTKLMEGRWYISAGLNPAFDCFDCQVSRPALRVALRDHVLASSHVFLEG